MNRTKPLPKDDDGELEMTPMIDVTFLLLVFFMCTLKFKTLEGKLAAYLPKDVGFEAVPAELLEKVGIRIRVLTAGNKLDLEGRPYAGTGRWRFDDTRVMEYGLGPVRTTDLDEVARRLRVLREKNADRPASIDARPGVVYADVVAVLDVALEAGYEEITFVGAAKGAK